MARAAVFALGLAIAAPAAALMSQQAPAPASPAPQIQNGRVETRRGTSIDREIAAVAPTTANDPVWVAWRVPMIAGDRDMCSWYSDRLGAMRGMFMEDGVVFVSGTGTPDTRRPQITPPTGPVPLEAGTGVIILARIFEGRVERLRTVGDDCPMDAGGRAVYWLDAVTPAESLRYLGTLVEAGPADRSPVDIERRIAETAVRAMGYHRDSGADSALDRVAASHRDSSVRRQAASTLASLRGAFGVSALTRLIAAAKDPEQRRALTSALGQSREASAVAALRGLTSDADARVRAEASYYFVLRGGTAVIPDALKIIASDADDGVRRRTVSALGRLPGDAGVTHLLQLARTSTHAVVRKEAATVLSHSRDPRAVAFMEEILKR